MDQLIFKSKWEDDDQLPPLVEEVYGPMKQGQNIELQSQSNTYLIDLLNIGYDGTTAIVCKNDKTIGDLKEMIYTQHQKSIPQPDKWIISDSENEYLNNQLLNEIGINNKTKLVAIQKQTDSPGIKIAIAYEQENKVYSIEVYENWTIRKLLLELTEMLQITEKSALYFQNQEMNPLKTFKELGVREGCQLKYKVFPMGGCFPGFAPVQLYDGSIKQIQDIQINDQVLSYDIDSKQFVSSQIVATHNSKVDQLIEILTSQQLIITTSNHPFLTEQGWKAVEPHPEFKIQYLTIQDKILNVQNQYEQIISIQYSVLEEKIAVYNITTRRPNNYIVYGYVVHNMNKINIRINGKFEEIEIFPDMRIYEIKVLISLKYGIDVLKIKFIYQEYQKDSQELKDQKQFKNYFKDKMIGTIDVIISDEGEKSGLEQKSNQISNKITYLTNNCLEFAIAIKQKELINLEDLVMCFRDKISQIQPFIKKLVDDIKQNPQKMKQFQQFQIHHLVAIKLWTSNLVYKQINIDLRNKKYDEWKAYLKCLMEALRLCKYYKGLSFRGLRDYQNTQFYQVGRTLQFSEVSCVSKILIVAKKFANQNGMILQIDQRSSKDIEQLSLFPNEQEIILLPFSQFIVTHVIQNVNEPIYVTLKELPQPRWFRVLLWVDDKPENCYPYAQELEKNHPDISVVFCISTDEAIDIIEKNRWMIFLPKTNLRIVTEMAIFENEKLNEIAGVDFMHHMYEVVKYKNEILVFCGDTKKAIQACKNKKLVGNYIITRKVDDLMKFLRFE